MFIAAFAAVVVWRVSKGPKQRPAPVVWEPPRPLPLEPPIELLRVANSGLPCEVDDVLARRCRRCHSTPPRHNAPFRLLTWEDAHADRGGQPLYLRLGQAVQTGFMPLLITANPPVEPLSDTEKKTLLDWVAAGAPRAECGGDAGAAADDAGPVANDSGAALDAGPERDAAR